MHIVHIFSFFHFFSLECVKLKIDESFETKRQAQFYVILVDY